MKIFLYGTIANNSSSIASYFRRKIISNSNCIIDTNVMIQNKYNFVAKEKSALFHGCYIANKDGFFSIGKKSHLGSYCSVLVQRGRVDIGDNVAIGPGTKIVVFSNYYKEGEFVVDVFICKDIKIGNNVFIGANCVILPGVNIADNVIVGANSLVNHSLESGWIYGGTPCRKIKRYCCLL